MYAENYIHNMVAKKCPIDGMSFGSGDITTADGISVRLDYSASSTTDQQSTAAAYVATLNYAMIESTLQQIAALEFSVTDRMIQSAVGGDTSVNPSWCGGQGGTAAQQIAWVNQQKATLRASLSS